MKKIQIFYIFVSGMISGIFVADALLMYGIRGGWRISGEVLILPLFGLLICMGVMIGRIFPERSRRHERRR